MRNLFSKSGFFGRQDRRLPTEGSSKTSPRESHKSGSPSPRPPEFDVLPLPPFSPKTGKPIGAILRIDASSRHEGSVSRLMADHLQRKLMAAWPAARIAHRDLARAAPPHLGAEAIAAFFTPADRQTDASRQACALSDTLVDEVLAADLLIIATPMYNFSIPSALKAWIDHVVRLGRSFAYDGQNFTGLITGKRAIVLCAYGAAGYGPGAGFAAANFVEPFLRFLLGFLGVADVTFITAEGLSGGEAASQTALQSAQRQIDALIGPV